jgi:hypothetical protein
MLLSQHEQQLQARNFCSEVTNSAHPQLSSLDDYFGIDTKPSCWVAGDAAWHAATLVLCADTVSRNVQHVKLLLLLPLQLLLPMFQV